MIQVKNLHLMHKKDLRPILENFSFALNPGDKAVVIGEEGNGKSTLLKLIALGDLDYAEWTGQIHRGGAKLGYLAQELTGEELARPAGQWWNPALAGPDPGPCRASAAHGPIVRRGAGETAAGPFIEPTAGYPAVG